jgi:hypothetical protein
LVSQNVIGMAMGIQDIFDTEAFCFDLGQQLVLISRRIDDNCIEAMWPPDKSELEMVLRKSA